MPARAIHARSVALMGTQRARRHARVGGAHSWALSALDDMHASAVDSSPPPSAHSNRTVHRFHLPPHESHHTQTPFIAEITPLQQMRQSALIRAYPLEIRYRDTLIEAELESDFMRAPLAIVLSHVKRYRMVLRLHGDLVRAA